MEGLKIKMTGFRQGYVILNCCSYFSIIKTGIKQAQFLSLPSRTSLQLVTLICEHFELSL